MGSLKGKRLLIVGAGPEQVPAYELALSMGIKVVGSDLNPKAPAFDLTSERIIASTYDADETVAAALEYHKKNPIDGVITLASDVPLTVASVAKALKLRSISLESARLTSNKLVQLKKFREDHIQIPKFREIDSIQNLQTVITEWGYPLIIKPPDNRGSRGVLRLTEKIDTKWAFEQSMAYSGTGSLIVQDFIQGKQISSETVVYQGKCAMTIYSDRNYEFLDRFAPYIIENGGRLPADITQLERDKLDLVINQVRESLNIENGHIKGDLIIQPNREVLVVEFASRMGGGYAVSHSIPIAHDVNPVLANIKIALGEPLHGDELSPKFKKAVALRFFFPEPGKVMKISGFNELANNKSLILTKMYINNGEIVEKVSDHTKRAGMVLAEGKDLSQAERSAIDAINQVDIRTESVV